MRLILKYLIGQVLKTKIDSVNQCVNVNKWAKDLVTGQIDYLRILCMVAYALLIIVLVSVHLYPIESVHLYAIDPF